ncbi:YbfB/YjiJ family MFS transporter [Amphritea sp. 1_MG-2023]|uniref:YbfB/YjiJ family MFS transporter n=1 Tax=Amphritea sp. 1_MG-2023 TaxID=3062670 RepID=UPI0026E47EE1|nr:YbfB/YjiJ family MFS transporter [Amphritea sp. 1_MG-2023]MDO6562399.1 YbfB/YjiJ family MFS transporter [Amphritea sp. 1_MG-2023]
MHNKTQRLKVLSSGILSLMLTMGIARFALTPMLPIMQQHAGLGISEGGGLAAINYFGYLCGALIAAMISDLVIKDRLYRCGLIMALVTTIGMGLTDNLWLWAVCRFLAGLSCAGGMLLGSGLILNWLMRHGHHSELGIHFCGVGLGIVLCAIAIESMQAYFDWREQWVLLTLIGVFIMIPAWRWLPPPDKTQQTTRGETLIDAPPSAAFMRLFQVAYFCAGVGYVISATFIVALVDQLPGLEGQGSWAFLIIGLAATPSAIGWDFIARRFGPLNALICASILQVIGILLPVIETSYLLTMIGAILYGGTFVGMVCLVLTMAGRYYPTRPAKMMGKMTLSFGTAQIIAPALAGLLAEHSGNYISAVYMAAFIMALGSILLLMLKAREPKTQSPLSSVN